MASPEEIVERRRAVAAVMATPGGVSRTDAAALAAEFGCCVSTVWGDILYIRWWRCLAKGLLR